jgi:hypothetical protein
MYTKYYLLEVYMVTFDEELALAIAEAKHDEDDSIESVFDWYAVEICTAIASEEGNMETFIQKLESHWEDFEDADSEDIYSIQREKHFGDE